MSVLCIRWLFGLDGFRHNYFPLEVFPCEKGLGMPWWARAACGVQLTKQTTQPTNQPPILLFRSRPATSVDWAQRRWSQKAKKTKCFQILDLARKAIRAWRSTKDHLNTIRNQKSWKTVGMSILCMRFEMLWTGAPGINDGMRLKRDCCLHICVYLWWWWCRVTPSKFGGWRYGWSRKGGSLIATLSIPEKEVRLERRFGTQKIENNVFTSMFDFLEIARVCDILAMCCRCIGDALAIAGYVLAMCWWCFGKV